MFEHGVPGVAALLVGELLEGHVFMSAAITEGALSFSLTAAEFAPGGVLSFQHVVVTGAYWPGMHVPKPPGITGVGLIGAWLAVAQVIRATRGSFRHKTR